MIGIQFPYNRFPYYIEIKIGYWKPERETKCSSNGMGGESIPSIAYLIIASHLAIAVGVRHKNMAKSNIDAAI